MVYLFFLVVGYLFSLIGITYIVGYMNLLLIGYNFYEYVNFITRRGECWLSVIGIIVLLITIIKGEIK